MIGAHEQPSDSLPHFRVWLEGSRKGLTIRDHDKGYYGVSYITEFHIYK